MKKLILLFGAFLWVASSLAQTDSLAHRLIYSWEIDEAGTPLLVQVDTNLAQFEAIYVWPQSYLSAGQTGTINGASVPRFFSIDYSLPSTLGYGKNYLPYFHTAETRQYYNTKRPYTQLYYSTGGGKDEAEQRIGVLHTQNIDSISNVGFDYDHISSLGRYLNQKTTSHFFSIFGSTQRAQYTLFTHFDYNKVEQNENGGIDSLHYLDANIYEKAINIPVKLDEGAANTQKNYQFHLFQRFDFKRSIKVSSSATDADSALTDSTARVSDSLSIGAEASSEDAPPDTVKIVTRGFPLYLSHRIDFSNVYHRFKDDNTSESFYDDLPVYIDSAFTNDRQWYRTFQNRLAVGVEVKGFQLEGFYKVDLQRYKYTITPDSTFTVDDTLVVTDNAQKYTDMRLGGYIRTQYKRFMIKGLAEYTFSGYRQNDYHIEGHVSTPLPVLTNVTFEGTFQQGLREPSFMHYRYRSNHFKWDNNFDKVIYLQATGSVGNRYLRAGASYTLLDKHVYLNSDALPQQHGSSVSILQARVQSHLSLWKFHLRFQGGWQNTSNKNVLPLPTFVAYGRLNLEHLFQFPSTGGELLMEVGVNSTYFSSYQSPAWMPVTGMFYNQTSLTIGNYALWNAFLNFKLKRTRFFLNYTHFNQTLGEERYFSTPYYPEPPATFKFGLSWTFYN
ncbi:MAG: putative porin [Bacteroidales bacterium]